MSIEERVKKIIVEQLGVKEEDVKPESKFLMKKLKKSQLFNLRLTTFKTISNF